MSRVSTILALGMISLWGYASSLDEVLQSVDELGVVYDRETVERAAIAGALRAIDPGASLLDSEPADADHPAGSPVSFDVWAGKLGYVDVGWLGASAADGTISNLVAWSEQELQGLILDLRGAGGDDLGAVDRLAGALVSGEQPAYEVVSERTGDAEKHPSEEAEVVCTIPMIALVDQSTRGTAELLAAILKERRRAMLIGETTVGDARVRRVVDVSDCLSFRIGVARIRMCSGESYDSVGVVPDISVTCAAPSTELSPLRDLTGTGKTRSDRARVDRELMTRVHGDPSLERATDILIGLAALGRREMQPASKCVDAVEMIEHRTIKADSEEKELLIGPDGLPDESNPPVQPEDK